MAERGVILEEIIRLDGRGVFTRGRCELCRQDGHYRCLDCVAVQFLCGDCMSRVHSFNPLHVIEVSFCISSEWFPAALTHWIEMERVSF